MSTDSFSENQGLLLGGGGEEKPRTRGRAPGDKVLTDQFQTVEVVWVSDWSKNTFVFFSAKSASSKTRSCFEFSHTKDTYRPVVLLTSCGKSHDFSVPCFAHGKSLKLCIIC